MPIFILPQRKEQTIDKILITGGAGFIGSNLAQHYLSKGAQVVIFDNLSRPGGGARKNLEYLTNKYRGEPNFEFVLGDVKKSEQLKKIMRGVNVVFHIAAQTAMTTSIEDPVEDFDTNVGGTFNLLEAVRNSDSNPALFYTSTNKVYGNLTRRPLKLVENEKRWDFADEEYFEGIDEEYPLDFEGPYGCSKGAADSYCLEYTRTFGLRTVVFRMSAIYGVGQHPTEDQGWVGWFIRRAMEKKPITIYGDGKQVRDILFITDLLDAFDKSLDNIEHTAGRAYNIGGGRRNSISIVELLDILRLELGIKPSNVNFGSWRIADQKVYISNSSKARREFNWEPVVSKEEGIKRLYEWMRKGER